eukprot:UN25136
MRPIISSCVCVCPFRCKLLKLRSKIYTLQSLKTTWRYRIKSVRCCILDSKFSSAPQEVFVEMKII